MTDQAVVELDSLLMERRRWGEGGDVCVCVCDCDQIERKPPPEKHIYLKG